MVTREQLAAAAKQAASQAGFDLAGVASLQPEDFPELEAFVEWIDAGHAGEMKYMEKRTETGALKRASVKHSAPWARSVIVCAVNYNADKPYSTRVKDARRGWISRYAWGACDYHDALMPRLRQVEAAIRELAAQQQMEVETRSYVDTGPLVERVYARHAGVGWIGKNTCIIHQKAGSWLFLGVILTSLDLAPDLPAADRCGSCTRCIDACPTNALTAPGKLDARRCIAYLTIEKRGNIPEELRDQMGQHVFGCDICQDVCPWNNKPGNAPATSLPEFQPREKLFHPDLEWLAQMDEENYRRTFRGSPVKRAKFSGLQRNVALAMGNSGSKEFIPLLEKMAAHGDPVIAEHARWALKKLSEK
ncbi:MAG TPA: tRNA epoxyqueuosine(34) reductase QueG [Candidatus Limnocylindrales bacterium]|nr:tRNA epoxyqueuosine(34) reductase QueG [Candidatus Limnocylindrales bacterium]